VLFYAARQRAMLYVGQTICHLKSKPPPYGQGSGTDQDYEHSGLNGRRYEMDLASGRMPSFESCYWLTFCPHVSWMGNEAVTTASNMRRLPSGLVLTQSLLHSTSLPFHFDPDQKGRLAKHSWDLGPLSSHHLDRLLLTCYYDIHQSLHWASCGSKAWRPGLLL